MRFYGFGEAPKAKQDGYGRLLKEVRGTEAEISEEFANLDVAVVRGPAIHDSASSLYGVFEKDVPGTSKKYDVHLYATVRLKFSGIEAESMEAAILKAEEKDLHALIDRMYAGDEADDGRCAYIEWDESLKEALVDIVGDPGYRLSQLFEFDGDRLVKKD